MMSGRETLARLDQAHADARRGVLDVETQIEAIELRLTGQLQAQAQDYQDLARLRLGQLADGSLIEQLDQAEREVSRLLARRQSAFAQLQEQIERAATERAVLDAERARLAAKFEEIAAAIDAAEAQTQARLQVDADYRQRLEAVHEAERTAAHARAKADEREAELERKGRAYREDPLFMYLWARRFGQPGYQAWAPIRWLDGKVARLIDYAEADANYARLNAIPERLRAHAAALADAAEAELQVLRAIDEAARTADGIPRLDAALAEARARLDALDERLHETEQATLELESRKSGYLDGTDELTRQALELLSGALQRDDLMVLRREALATPYPEDDRIIARLLEREDERRRLEVSLQGLREALARHRERLREIETLRADFRLHGFERPGSTFGDQALIATMLAQFIAGALDRQHLWRVLEEQQRDRPERSNPGFGSGGFGRDTIWSGGLGRAVRPGARLGGGERARRGGEGGGFRTGGGF